MNYRMLTKIACKLIALRFFLQGMIFTPSIFITLISYKSEFPNFSQDFLPSISSGIITLLASALLWIFADKISIAIVNEAPESIERQEIDYNKIAVIAFAIAGLMVLANAIPDATRMLIEHSWKMTNLLNYKETGSYTDMVVRIIGELVKVGLGIWLVIGSKGIFKGIKSLRDLGLDRIKNVEE